MCQNDTPALSELPLGAVQIKRVNVEQPILLWHITEIRKPPPVFVNTHSYHLFFFKCFAHRVAFYSRACFIFLMEVLF